MNTPKPRTRTRRRRWRMGSRCANTSLPPRKPSPPLPFRSLFPSLPFLLFLFFLPPSLPESIVTNRTPPMQQRPHMGPMRIPVHRATRLPPRHRTAMVREPGLQARGYVVYSSPPISHTPFHHRTSTQNPSSTQTSPCFVASHMPPPIPPIPIITPEPL